MTFDELLRQGQKILKENSIENHRLDARILLAHVLGVEQNKIFAFAVDEMQQDMFWNLIKRRCNREPVSRIIGKRGFWKDDFYISKETLDPRPDTETLIEAVLSAINNKNQALNILDLGTGSGCIALSLAREFPNAKVIGIDASEAAVDTAKANALNLNLENRCQFMKVDWNHLKGLPINSFDIVVSNPPYIKEKEIAELEPEVKIFDPLLALSGGESGLDAYVEISHILSTLLKRKALVFLEIGEQQHHEVTDIFNKKGFFLKDKYCDLSSKIRCLSFSF